MNIAGFEFRSPIVNRREPVLVCITPEGRAEAESYTNGGPKFAVLSALHEASGGTLSIQNVCRITKIDMPRVKAILKDLMGNGYVKRIGNQQQQPQADIPMVTE